MSEPAVGIDLGTTYSVIARLDDLGSPRVIPNADGDLSTPSVVYFHDTGVVVGKEAVKVGRYEPEAVAAFAKRDMGKSDYHKTIRGRRLPPELIQALILRQLRQDALLKLGEFRKVVITVPAYFNEPRRQATVDAGRVAGLEVLDIINEPTAAAFAYGMQAGFLGADGRSQRREEILVYDLGGGTFDVTLMEIDGLRCRALATDGDVFLGGIDWDERIAAFVADQFEGEFGVDVRGDAAAYQCLLQEAEDAKRALSSRAKVVIHFTYGQHQLSIPFSAEQLEALTGDLVDRTTFTVKNLLNEAGRQWRDLTRILLVGGSSRMPLIQKALEQESGLALDRSLLTEEPVAMGAAIYAGILLKQGGDRPEMQVQNISSHPLGVLGTELRTGHPRRKVLIPRNTPLPASGDGIFVTRQDNQAKVVVNVVEGGDASGRHATRIGQCVVSGLPPRLRKGTRVKVMFAYATNGRLTVTAELPSVQAQVTMTVDRASGLSEDALEEWRRWLEAGAVLEVADEGEQSADPGKDQPAMPGVPQTLHAAQRLEEPSDFDAASPADKSQRPSPGLDLGDFLEDLV